MLIFHRIKYYFKTLPLRFGRLGLHLVSGMQSLVGKSKNYDWYKQHKFNFIIRIGIWWLELNLLITDILGIPEFYNNVCDIIKWKSRELSEREIQLGREVFGNSIPYECVRIDETALIGLRWGRMAMAYVSFFNINSLYKMSDSVYIHELIHIWQYHNFGSVYLVRALFAQKSQMQYNYGGVNALTHAIKTRQHFLDFNFEQQGDLVMDYFRIKYGYKPHWGTGNKNDLVHYKYFLNQIQRMGRVGVRGGK